MARYFRVEKDTALPRAYRAVRDNSGTVYDYEVEGVAYDKGTIVEESHIDPRVLERLDEGDEHLNSLLTEVSESDLAEYNQNLKVANQLVKFPEHTVEAYVLASDPAEPYLLLSDEEGVELTSHDQEAAAEAQKDAKEELGDNVGPGDEESFTAIDFATAKGEADKEAGESVAPAEVVSEEGEAPSQPEPEAPVAPPVQTPDAEPVPPEVAAEKVEEVLSDSSDSDSGSKPASKSSSKKKS